MRRRTNDIPPRSSASQRQPRGALQTYLRTVITVCSLVLVCTSYPVSVAFGQVAPRSDSDRIAVASPDALVLGQEAQVFVDLPAGQYQGVRIVLPLGCRVVETRVESYESGTIEHDLRLSGDGRRGDVILSHVPSGDAVVIVGVKTGNVAVEDVVSITPFTRQFGETITDLSNVVVRRIEIDRAARSRNRVLAVSRKRSVLELEERRLDTIRSDDVFTIATWVSTTDLGGIVLSSWTGDENDRYPFELLVGVDGGAVFYRGKTGEHQSMRSTTPIADGTWHHVAVASDPIDEHAVLYVDGVAVDSLVGSLAYPGEGIRLMVGGRLAPGSDRPIRPTGLFDGLVDDVGYWNHELSAQEIKDLATGEVDAVRQPLIFQQFSQADLDEGRLPVFVSLRSSAVVSEEPILGLSGKLNAGSVELSWRSAAADIDGFLVQRSEDGIEFETIGSVLPVSDHDAYSYLDTFIDSEVLFYRIVQATQVDASHSPIIKLGVADPMETTEGFLQGNAPNPFSGTTSINYQIPEAGHVRISVWDLSGQPVQTLVDAQHSPGQYEVLFSAGDLSAGTYFIRMRYLDRLESAKMLLVK